MRSHAFPASTRPRRSLRACVLSLLTCGLTLAAAVPARAGPDDPSGPIAALASGLAHLEAGRHVEAIPTLESALGTSLDDLTRYSLARALLAAERPEDAIPCLDGVRNDPRSPWRPLAARLYPDAQRAAGRIRKAIRAYQELLERYRELPDRPLVLSRLAGCWQELRRGRNEAETLSQLVWEHPEAPEAAAAQERLAALAEKRVKTPPRTFRDRLERVTLWTRDRRFDLAYAELDVAQAMAGRSGTRRESVELHRVRAWMRQQRYEDVVQALRERCERHPEKHIELSQALITALRRSGEVDAGLTILRRLTRRSKAASQEQLAKALLEEGRLAEADRLFRRIYRTKRDQPGRHWPVVWIDYRLGRTELALAGFAEVARRNRGQRLRADYWRARTLLEAGRQEEAIPVFREVAGKGPQHYYGYQARSRLFELGAPDEAFEARTDSLRERVAAQGGRVSPPLSDIAEVTDRPTPEASVLHQIAERHGELMPRLRRASLLLRLGRLEDARRELRLQLAEIDAVRKRPRAVSRLIGRPLSGFLDRRRSPAGVWGEDLGKKLRVRLSRRQWKAERGRLVSLRKLSRKTLEELREAFRALGDAWGVRRLTFRLEYYSKGVPTDENRDYYMDTHPLAWRELVVPEAKRYGLDPSFVWAVMTVESAFNETAHSVANARGLLQILPRTAWLVARDVGDPAPHPTALLDPARNIRWGTWYLDALVRRFQGQELLAAASYNAGPHRVAWRVQRVADQPFDVVLEDLPAWAGREYAKKVLKYWAHYRRVYLNDSVVYIGQKALAPVDGVSY